MDNKDYLRRYSAVMRRIGTARLLALPEDIKQVLQRTGHLRTKVEMLEMIEKELNNGRY